MRFFIQELVNGLTQGSLYALIALGYSMVYGILKLLNFAHGDLYMVGAFVGYFVIQWFGGSTALVISFLLENSMLLLFGASFRDYNMSAFIPFSSGIHIGVLNISLTRLLVIVLSLVLMIGLRLLVDKTKLGRQMRAVAEDREAAEMLGVNVDYTISMTFFLGSALAGIAGVMAGLVFNQIYTLMGFVAGLKAFTAAVVGGIGSITGAMLGGLLIGLAESFISGYISSTYTNLIVFGILIVVMILRPQGLLGRAPLQKV